MIFTNPLFFYIGVLWLISAFFEYSRYCYIWQLKEYRFDIFSDFLSTKQGKEFVYQYPVMLRSLCIILLFFLLPVNTFTTALYILFVILLASGCYAVPVKFFVSSSGDDKNTGKTAAAAFRTLGRTQIAAQDVSKISGVEISIAFEGVDALTSATKSLITKSFSCPTALIIVV